MSAIASFILLPKSALDDLRDAAVPKKTLFGGRKDRFHEFLERRGSEAATYNWSGYIIATLLPFLDSRGVRLMKSEYDELSSFLSKERKSTCFMLTPEHKRLYGEKLSPASYSEAELRDYYNQFNARSEPESGKPMLDGIRALHTALAQLDDQSVVLLHIG